VTGEENRLYLKGYRSGRAYERAKIVAWIRAIEATGKRGPWPRGYADALEHREHLSASVDRSGEAGETPKSGSTEGESAVGEAETPVTDDELWTARDTLSRKMMEGF
jgi:hypothetical protein